MLNAMISLLRRAALAAALAATSSLAAAGTIHVSVDTSTLGADSGYLEMYLSASGGVPPATATISNLSGFAMTDLDIGQSFGFDIVGGQYVLRNDTLNDVLHAVNFGGVLGFDLTFAGDPHPDWDTYSSYFVVAALDSDFLPLGPNKDTSGTLQEYYWIPATVPGANGSVGTVPEPGAWLLMGAGAIGMALARRRRPAA